MRDNFSTINATRQRMTAISDAERISEIARLASSYQAQGLTRTHALAMAENLDPNGYRAEVTLTPDQGEQLGFTPVPEAICHEELPRG